MKKYNRIVIICRPLFEPGVAVEGSIVGNCADCGKLIVVAPSTLRFKKDNPKTEIVCNECGAKRMIMSGVTTIEPVPGSIAEAMKYFQEQN